MAVEYLEQSPRAAATGDMLPAPAASGDRRCEPVQADLRDSAPEAPPQ